MRTASIVCALAAGIGMSGLVTSSLAAEPVPVTVDNFIRAETDLYFGNMMKESSLGQFAHRREPAAIDSQTIIRLNRDTLYSAAIFDLDAGPVTITLPDAGGALHIDGGDQPGPLCA